MNYSGLSGPATDGAFPWTCRSRQERRRRCSDPECRHSPAEGSATLTDAQAADLMAGKYYINVHTAANPAAKSADR